MKRINQAYFEYFFALFSPAAVDYLIRTVKGDNMFLNNELFNNQT